MSTILPDEDSDIDQMPQSLSRDATAQKPWRECFGTESMAIVFWSGALTPSTAPRRRRSPGNKSTSCHNQVESTDLRIKSPQRQVGPKKRSKSPQRCKKASQSPPKRTKSPQRCNKSPSQ